MRVELLPLLSFWAVGIAKLRAAGTQSSFEDDGADGFEQQNPTSNFDHDHMLLIRDKHQQHTQKVDLLILICTQSFTAEELVEDILLGRLSAEEGASSWSVKVALVDEAGLDWSSGTNIDTDQQQERPWTLGDVAHVVLIVASTYGDGDPPNHATEFADWLKRSTEQRQKFQQEVAASGARAVDESFLEPLHDFAYAIFGLGDTEYAHFCAFAFYCDRYLTNHYGSPGVQQAAPTIHRLLPVYTGDVQSGDMPQFFAQWADEAVKAAASILGTGNVMLNEEGSEPPPQQHQPLSLFSSTGTDWRRSAIDPASVTAALEGTKELLLHSSESDNETEESRSVLHVSLSLPSSLATWALQSGDYLGVYPRNPAAIVEQVMEWLFLKSHSTTKIMEKHHTMRAWMERTISAHEFLTTHVDLCGRATLSTLRALLPFAGTLQLRALARDLTAIDTNTDNHNDGKNKGAVSRWDRWRNGRRLTKFDLAVLFECRPSLQALARALGPIQPRLYSIATVHHHHHHHLDNNGIAETSNMKTTTIGLCMAVTSGGLTTESFIATLPVGSPVTVVASPNPKFHFTPSLHGEAASTTYMIAAGSGIGPYVGFLEEQAVAARTTAAASSSKFHILVGSRTRQDVLYQDQLTQWEQMGVSLHFAFSRVFGQPKRYVQDLLLQSDLAGSIWNDLFVETHDSDNTGRMYVCGRLEICDGVQQALIQLAQDQGGLSPRDAFQRVRMLEEQGRLSTDCWSVVDPPTSAAVNSTHEDLSVLPPEHVVPRLARHHGSPVATTASECEARAPSMNDADDFLDENDAALDRVPTWPSYLRLLATGELHRRVQNATAMHSACVACGRFCEVNRLSTDPADWGECRVGERAIVFVHDAHFGEEPCLKGTRGSGTIFFGACNLKCTYCQNWKLSVMDQGELVSPERLAEMMLELQAWGCHNINFVSPTHNVLAILQGVLIAAERGLRLPLVWNTGGYDSVASLRLLEGIIDIYMPDAKYANRKVARKLSKIDNYPEINHAAIKEMHRQVGDLQIDPRTGLAFRGVLVRHLVLPEDYAGTTDVASFLASEVSANTYTHVMDYYRPEHEAATDTKYGLNRKPTRRELHEAHERARCASLKRILHTEVGNEEGWVDECSAYNDEGN